MPTDSRLHDELRRLNEGPRLDERPGGIGTVRFVAPCPFGANEVLAKVKSVLRIVDQVALTHWLSHEEWAAKLPEWFTARCAPEETREEADEWLVRWKNLPPEEQARIREEGDWSLDNWLYWLQPPNRQWFWWDAKALDDIDHIIVAVEVEAWPFPWASLKWLFKAAGASALEAEE